MMRKTVMYLMLALFILMMPSCTLEYNPNTPLYGETRHEPLTDGTYYRKGSRYTCFMDVQNGPTHHDRASVLLSVYMDDIDGESLVKIGTFEGYIEHNELMYDSRAGGRSVRIHRDDIVFTNYEGSMFVNDEEAMSGTYEIAYRGARDISTSEYGHVYIPVAGTLAYLESVNGYLTDPDWGGLLSGVWEKRP